LSRQNDTMGFHSPDSDLKLIIGIAIGSVIAIIVFWFVIYGEFPWADLFDPAGSINASVSDNGTPLDPALEKVAAVQSYFTDMGTAMINGSYWQK